MVSTAPGETYNPITPSDSADIAGGPIRGLAFASAGTIKVTDTAGNVKVIPSGALAAGMIHPLVIRRLWDTGTTATGFLGVF